MSFVSNAFAVLSDAVRALKGKITFLATTGNGLEARNASEVAQAGILYDSTLTSKWKAGASASESEVITAAGAQTLSGVKTFSSTAIMSAGFTGMGQITDIDTYDSAKVLTSADTLVAATITTARVWTLPTTGVKKGVPHRYINKGAFDLSFIASAGAAMTIAGGANQDATINNGVVVLIPLQDTPTTPAHWYVEHVQEAFTTTVTAETGAGSSWTTAATFTIKVVRNNKAVQLSSQNMVTNLKTSSASSQLITTAMPTRLKPLANTVLAEPGVMREGNQVVSVAGAGSPARWFILEYTVASNCLTINSLTGTGGAFNWSTATVSGGMYAMNATYTLG